jgi:ABC-2 type transport system permease protein
MSAPVGAMLPLLGRRYGAWVAAWVVTIGIMVVVTLPAYASTYRDAAARRAAVTLAQADAATTLLYGRLPDPGTPAQMFSWEVGTFATLLVAVMGVLIAVRLSRVAEEDGTLEVVRGAGLGRQGPLVAAFVLLGAVALLLSTICALGVGFRAGHVAGVTWSGAWAFGFAVGGTFVLMALLTVVLSQLVPTSRATRVSGVLLLAGCFAARATADTQDTGWLNWWTPLGLRATMRPFTADSWWPFASVVAAAVTLAGLSLALNARRELGSSILRAPVRQQSRLRVHSPFGLAWRLHRSTVVVWSIATALGGALFVAMGSGVIESARRGQVTGGFLKSQLGDGDPVGAYLGYIGAVIGMVVAVFAILSTLASATDEQRGAAEYLRGTGAAPAAVVAAGAAIALLGSAVAICSTTLLTAVVAPHFIGGSGTAGQVLEQIGGQWSSVLVLVGPVLLLAGWRPRLAWLGWVPFAVSVALALVGRLLQVPEWLVDLGAFDHPDGFVTPVLRVAVFALAATIGLTLVRRRDLAIG